MRSVPVPKAKVARRQTERVAGKHVARPGSCQTRHDHRINLMAPVNAQRRLNNSSVRGCAVGIVAAGHVHFDVAEAAFRKMRDRKSTRLNSSHRCISYAVFCLKKKKKITVNTQTL